MKILITGALLSTEHSGVGGATVSTSLLVNQLKMRDNIEIKILDTLGIRGKGVLGILRFLKLIVNLFIQMSHCDVVVIVVNTTVLHILGPVVGSLNLITRKPFIIRKYANTDYRVFGKRRIKFSDWAIRSSDLYLLETKGLVALSESMGYKNARWFANNRVMPDIKKESNKCRKFVFLSRIVQGKGIKQIIDAGERFDDSVTVDLYGPMGYDVPLSDFEGLKRVRYLGFVDDAIITLSQYDALLLPTYLFTEGNPGVILEAYSVGLPVICTRTPALMEVVDETSGMLVEAESSDSLYDAMKRLVDDDDLYKKLCAGVTEKRHQFSSQYWTDKFIEYCKEAITIRELKGKKH